LIITVIECTTKQKLILWQSLHVEVNRHHGSVCVASRATLINTTLIGQKLDDQESECSAEGGNRRGQSPPGQLTSGAGKARRAPSPTGISGELCSCVDHFRGGDGAVWGYRRGI
jgi:hypothetical protein